LQPNSGFNYTYLGTVGTACLKDISAHVWGIAIPGTYVGTVELYDQATAGTAAATAFGTFGLPGLNSMRTLELNISTKKGLTYAALGTPNVLLVWI
jgi:hypothetical protein